MKYLATKLEAEKTFEKTDEWITATGETYDELFAVVEDSKKYFPEFNYVVFLAYDVNKINRYDSIRIIVVQNTDVYVKETKGQYILADLYTAKLVQSFYALSDKLGIRRG